MRTATLINDNAAPTKIHLGSWTFMKLGAFGTKVRQCHSRLYNDFQRVLMPILLSGFSNVQRQPFAKDRRIGSLQDVIQNAFPRITSKEFVCLLLLHVEVAQHLFSSCSSVFWEVLPAEVILALLTNKISSIYFFSVQLQRFTHLFSGSTFSFSWSESLLLVVQSPNPKCLCVSLDCFREYSVKWMG